MKSSALRFHISEIHELLRLKIAVGVQRAQYIFNTVYPSGLTGEHTGNTDGDLSLTNFDILYLINILVCKSGRGVFVWAQPPYLHASKVLPFAVWSCLCLVGCHIYLDH